MDGLPVAGIHGVEGLGAWGPLALACQAACDHSPVGARVAELVYAPGLGPGGPRGPCGFESHPAHQHVHRREVATAMPTGSESDPTSLAVTVEEEGAVSRTLRVEVPPERVDATFTRAYRDLARNARVRGFRPGKAPRHVLEKLYGASLAEDLERTLVEQSLPEALAQVGVEPVARPTIDAMAPAPGTAFAYTVRIEVMPTFALPKLEGLPGRRPAVDVGVADVQSELDGLHARHATLVEEAEDAEAAEGHVLTIDYEGRVDGELLEGGRGEGVEVELGTARFLPGFEDQLVGARSGEAREVRCALPEGDDSPHAGKEVVFQV